VTRPEQTIHRTVIQHLRQRGAQDMVYLHPANGGLRSFFKVSVSAAARVTCCCGTREKVLRLS
jgi:hypothetical protein